MITSPIGVSAAEAARLLGLSPSTLAKLRLSGNGPPYCKLGRRVLYRPLDLSAWVEGNRRHSTSDTGAPYGEHG